MQLQPTSAHQNCVLAPFQTTTKNFQATLTNQCNRNRLPHTNTASWHLFEPQLKTCHPGLSSSRVQRDLLRGRDLLSNNPRTTRSINRGPSKHPAPYPSTAGSKISNFPDPLPCNRARTPSGNVSTGLFVCPTAAPQITGTRIFRLPDGNITHHNSLLALNPPLLLQWHRRAIHLIRLHPAILNHRNRAP